MNKSALVMKIFLRMENEITQITGDYFLNLIRVKKYSFFSKLHQEFIPLNSIGN